MRSFNTPIRLCFVLFVAGLTLAACGSGGDTPASAAENYIRTRITGDGPKLIALACKDRESQARDEAASFAGQNTTLENVACKQEGEDGEFTLVRCTGTMIKSYAGETRNFDLAARAFKLLREDGAWKVCGMK